MIKQDKNWVTWLVIGIALFIAGTCVKNDLLSFVLLIISGIIIFISGGVFCHLEKWGYAIPLLYDTCQGSEFVFDERIGKNHIIITLLDGSRVIAYVPEGTPGLEKLKEGQKFTHDGIEIHYHKED